MSKQLVSHSSDLTQLQDEGYDIRISEGNLLHVRIPYVKQDLSIGFGFLVAGLTIELDSSGVERTGAPNTHVVNFVGSSPEDLPCDYLGAPLEALMNQATPIPLGDGVTASCSFSHKPDPTYSNHYEQMSTYADMLLSEVHMIDPNIKVRTFPPISLDENESVFRYRDSATSRARIGAVTDKIKGQKIAIIGIGGTGSYVLDAVAKSAVNEVHIYDGDFMLTHNAFRSPGATSIEQLTFRPYKANLHQETYSKLRRGVIAHPVDLDEKNIEELQNMDFVFICMDSNPTKRFIIEKLHEFNVPMVDTGMGIYQAGDSLAGMVRTSASNAKQANKTWILDELSFVDDDLNEYEQNIQIAELNMLNAALAVIKWKKYFNFYIDFESETSSIYTIDGNHIQNENSLNED